MAHIETRHIETMHDLIEDWIRGTTDDGKFNLNKSYRPWLEFEQFPSHYTLGNLLDELRTVAPESSLFPMQRMVFRAWDEIYDPIAAARKPFAGSYFFFRILTLDGQSWLLRPAPASTGESPFRFDALRRILKILESDDQVSVITGYSHDELQRFIARPLGAYFDSEGMRHSYVSSSTETVRRGDPEIIIADWSKEIEKNPRLMRALRSHLKASRGNRLIILYSIASNILNYTKALGLMPFIEGISPRSLIRVPVVGLLPQFMNAWQVADELFTETTTTKVGAAKVILSNLPALPFIVDQLRPRLGGEFTQQWLEKVIAEIEGSVMGDQRVFIYSGDRIKPQGEFPQNIYYVKKGYEVFYLQAGKGQASIPPVFNPNAIGEQGIAPAGFSTAVSNAAVSAATFLNNFNVLSAPPLPSIILAHFLLQ